MKLFAGSASQDLGSELAVKLNIPLGKYEHHVFPDGEQRVRLEEDVLDEEVLIIQSTGIPTDINYFELLLMIDAVKRSGAKKLTCILPYMGYSRQDHVFRSGEARSLEVIIRAMETNGVDEFICVDLHSVKIPEIFRKPVKHISAMSLFASEIKSQGLITNESSLVSPDMGGLNRLEKLSDMLDGMRMVAIEKNRDTKSGKIDASDIHGDPTKISVIVDDMISSGNTINQAIEMLSAKGSKEFYVFATHAIFNGDASYNLQVGFARKVIVTNTIHVEPNNRFEKLEVLSVADLIVGAINN